MQYVPKNKLEEAEERIASGNDFLIKLGIKELEKPEYQDNPEALELLGHGHAFRKSYTKAMDAFLKGYRLTQDDYFWGLFAAVKLFTDDYEAGREILEKMMAQGQVDRRFYTDLAQNYLAHDEPERALRTLDSGLGIREYAPWHVTYLALKALTFLHLEREEDSKETALRAVSEHMKKGYQGFADVPLSVAKGFSERVNCPLSFQEALCMLMTAWIEEATSASLEIRADEFDFWEDIYSEDVEPGNREVEHTPSAIKITMEIFEEMAPYRRAVNEDLL